MRRGGTRYAWAAVALVGLCMVPTAMGTCATFAAWLRSENVKPTGAMCGGVPCGTDVTAFATLTVAADAKSVVVTMQVTAKGGAAGRKFTGAGIFGPALAGQVKPMGSGALLTLGMPVMKAGASYSSVVRLTTGDMTSLLSYLRAGATYMSISTQGNPDGELRGQLQAPDCYETPLVGAPLMDGLVMPYGFANVLVSKSEPSYAVLIQMASDVERAFPGKPAMAQIYTAGGSPILPAAISTSGATNFYQTPRPEDVTMMNDVFMPSGEVNFEGVEEVAYSVGHMVGNAVVGALRSQGVVVEIQSNTPDMYEIRANVTQAMKCRQLISTHDTLFTMATARGGDWITLWSMNDGQPDTKNTLEPRYYAHPFEVRSGSNFRPTYLLISCLSSLPGWVAIQLLSCRILQSSCSFSPLSASLRPCACQA